MYHQPAECGCRQLRDDIQFRIFFLYTLSDKIRKYSVSGVVTKYSIENTKCIQCLRSNYPRLS